MDEIFSCDLCKKEYNSCQSLTNHKRLYHPETQDYT